MIRPMFMKTALCSLAAACAIGIVASRPADAADCYRTYFNQLESCSVQPTWYERTFCGADALASYVGCMRKKILGI